MLTSWEADALKVRLNGDGHTLTVLTGVDIPMKDLETIWSGSLEGTFRRDLGMIAPLPKVAVETAQGKSFFTGRDLTRKESAAFGRLAEHLPGPIRDWVGWRKDIEKETGRSRYTVDAVRLNLISTALFASRVISTSDRIFKRWAEDEALAPILLDTATGLRFKELNLTEEQARRLRERKRQLEAALERRGVLRRFKVGGKPAPGP